MPYFRKIWATIWNLCQPEKTRYHVQPAGCHRRQINHDQKIGHAEIIACCHQNLGRMEKKNVAPLVQRCSFYCFFGGCKNPISLAKIFQRDCPSAPFSIFTKPKGPSAATIYVWVFGKEEGRSLAGPKIDGAHFYLFWRNKGKIWVWCHLENNLPPRQISEKTRQKAQSSSRKKEKRQEKRIWANQLDQSAGHIEHHGLHHKYSADHGSWTSNPDHDCWLYVFKGGHLYYWN